MVNYLGISVLLVLSVFVVDTSAVLSAPLVDLIDAHSVRVRFQFDYGAVRTTLTNLYIQYRAGSDFTIGSSASAVDGNVWHTFVNSSGMATATDFSTPLSRPDFLRNVTVTGLPAGTPHVFRIVYQQTGNSWTTSPSAPATTLADSADVSLYYLYVGGGGGYRFNFPGVSGGVTPFVCSIPALTQVVSVVVIGNNPSAILFNGSDTDNLVLVPSISSVASNQPLMSLRTTQYNYTSYLPSSPQNVTWWISFSLTAQNGISNTTFNISIQRANTGVNLSINLPSALQSVVLGAVTHNLSLTANALVFNGNSITSLSAWKIWSERQDLLPDSSLIVTAPVSSDPSSVQVNIAPVGLTGSRFCIVIHIAVFDVFGGTAQGQTCLHVLGDFTSSQPYGAVTSWPAFITTGDIPPPHCASPYYCQ